MCLIDESMKVAHRFSSFFLSFLPLSVAFIRPHAQPVLVLRKLWIVRMRSKSHRNCFVFILSSMCVECCSLVWCCLLFFAALVYALYFIASWFISYRLHTSCRPQILLSLFFSKQIHVEFFAFLFFWILFCYFYRLRTHCDQCGGYYRRLCAAERNAILRISPIYTRISHSMITNK